MSDDRGTVRAIEWREVFPAVTLLGALRMSIQLRSLLLAMMAIIGTAAGWRLCGELFVDRPAANSVEPAPAADPEDAAFQATLADNGAWPWERIVRAPQLRHLTSLEAWVAQSPILSVWNEISAPFERIYRAEASFTELMYWLCCALWSLLVWSFFGGAISRTTAVAVARQENVNWGPLSSFVRKRMAQYFLAPLFPIMATFLGACFLALVGLIMRLDVGVAAAGLLWPLVLLGGFTMAFLLIGLFFAWPLMWAAISAEGTDAFGALSHAYSYTYQRPLHYLCYTVVASVLGLIGWFLVDLFAFWVIQLSEWGVTWGSGAERWQAIKDATQLEGALAWGRWFIVFWTNAVLTLAFAYLFSYFWTSTTVIYFLLRRLVDATEIDEVFLPEEQEFHGLPPLKTGPDGVADIVEEPTSAEG